MAGPAETEPLLRAPDVHDEEPCPATGESTASRIAKAQLTTKLPAVMLNFATTGLGQSAIGALIPDIETYYHLKNGPTAFIFPSVIMGYFAAVYLMETMHQRYGRRGLAIVGPLARIAGCGILAFGGPFPVALMSYLIFGFGTGFTDAGLCAWGSGVPFANVVQGIMHGTWSVGCVFGPLVVVHFVDGRMPWYGFYRLLVGISARLLEPTLTHIGHLFHSGAGSTHTRVPPRQRCEVLRKPAHEVHTQHQVQSVTLQAHLAMCSVLVSLLRNGVFIW